MFFEVFYMCDDLNLRHLFVNLKGELLLGEPPHYHSHLLTLHVQALLLDTHGHTAFSLILLVAFLVGLYRGMRAQVLIFSWKCRTKTSMMTRRRTWSPSNTTYCTNSWLKHTHMYMYLLIMGSLLLFSSNNV